MSPKPFEILELMIACYCYILALSSILSVLGHSHGSSHLHDHYRDHAHLAQDSLWEIWIPALGSSILIGVAPVFLLYVLPFSVQKNLSIFLAFAVGGLLGDVFLHLLPHAMEPQCGHHEHGYWGTQVLAGIMSFFILDKIVRTFGGHAHHHDMSGIHKKTDGDPNYQNTQDLKLDYASMILNMTADFAHNITDGLFDNSVDLTLKALL